MKKLIAFVLAFTMAAAMAVPALADDGSTTDTTNNTNVTGEGPGASIPVHGTYQGPKDVVSVDVVWDAMDFIYTDASEGTWNPTTHKYEYPTTAGWSWKKPEGVTKDAPEITLTNHSNVGVKAAFDFAASTGLENLTGSFTNLTDNAFTLSTAVGTELANAPSKATAFSLTGTGITETSKELGNITVSISKDESTPDTPEETATQVSSETDLQQAITEGKSVKLADNITLTGGLNLSAYNGTIDLNEKTLTLPVDAKLQMTDNSNVTINNGTIKGTADDNVVYIGYAGFVTMNDCTIENSKGYYNTSVFTADGDSGAFLNNCTFINTGSACAVRVKGGSVSLSGTTTVTNSTPAVVDAGILTCLAGTYNFDPSAYVYDSKYEVAKNNDNTWTVTANE